MGKAARLRRERRKTQYAPSPTQLASLRTVVLATSALVVLAAAAVAVLLVTRSSTKAPPPAATGGFANAPASLVAAADKVGFTPNVEPGVGRLENEPVSAANPPSNPSLLPVGSKAPAFTLRTSTGEEVTLAGYRGKAVLLEFYATWCPFCAAETPHVRDLFATLPASTYAWLSVNADGEDAASVFAYDRYFAVESLSLLDPSARPGNFHQPGAPGPVTTAYHIQSFPTFYVLDGSGRITWRADGEQPDALLRQELRKAAGA